MSGSTSVRRDPVSSSITDLLTLSVAGLEPMLDRSRGIFCDRLVAGPRGLVAQGLSPRYTAMTLLGLHRYEKAGARSPFAVRDLTVQLVRKTDWLEGVGDLGLLLWTCAEIAPELLDEFVGRTHAMTALERWPDAQRGSTMELAWFLTGIAQRVLAEPTQKHRWEPTARACYALLQRNQGPSGFFGHLATRANLRGWLRGRIGSFADQVYPILALTHFAEAFHDQAALAAAQACARAICQVQGRLGQWWWHYDAGSGRVAQRYPVYSVHQDGMAPMALFALGRVSGRDFSEPALKGLEWIYGQNELGLDMRDLQHRVIWRAIRFPSRPRMIREELRLWLRLSRDGVPPSGLTVLHECRPYHLGWLLYAFAAQPRGSAA